MPYTETCQSVSGVVLYYRACLYLEVTSRTDNCAECLTQWRLSVNIPLKAAINPIFNRLNICGLQQFKMDVSPSGLRASHMNDRFLFYTIIIIIIIIDYGLIFSNTNKHHVER